MKGNSYKNVVPSGCLSSSGSKILVTPWRPSWMASSQVFKKTVYAFVWSAAVRTCREPSGLTPAMNYFEMRRQRKYFDVTQETRYLRCLAVHDNLGQGKTENRQTNWDLKLVKFSQCGFQSKFTAVHQEMDSVCMYKPQLSIFHAIHSAILLASVIYNVFLV